MQTRTIGPVTVSAIGLGGMPMSIEDRPDEAQSIRTIHAALEAGVTLIDTADAYHLLPGETGHNERLIAKAPWSPLGGSDAAPQLGTRHAAFGEIAEAYGVSPQRVTLAWMLAKAPVVIPIPGARRPESIIDSAQAPQLRLTAEELSVLDAS
jgi:aryl-alcohol dehydrogenase-like predicted oxidoreductase